MPVRKPVSPGKVEILADLRQDTKIKRSSSLHRISVETKSSTQLKKSYPVQAQIHFSYSDSSDDDSASFGGSSSDDNSFAPTKPLQKNMKSVELQVVTDELAEMTNNVMPLSPTSKRKLLKSKNISRDRMSARIRPLSPQNSGNVSLSHSARPLKNYDVSSTNHAANARRNRLASTLRARSVDKNLFNQKDEDAPQSNIGKQLRKKRLQQQKLENSLLKGRIQQGNTNDRGYC